MTRPRLSVPANHLKAFRRRARLAYPKETIELLFGRLGRGGSVDVVAFLPVEHRAGPKHVNFDINNDYENAREQAEDSGLIFLGSIHSHPDERETGPSDADYLAAIEDDELIMGICAVWKARDRLMTRVGWWLTAGCPQVRYF